MNHPVNPDAEFTLTQIVFPYHVNHYGTLFGGFALQWMDQAAWLCATRFARKTMVTIASDRVEFKRSVPEGTIVMLRAKIARIGNTSVTVDVEMQAERPLTAERYLATRGQFVMVALNEAGKPTSVRN